MFKKCIFFINLIFTISISLAAQTHISVPLENPVYIVIEQAQIRGLCGYLPSTKPYSQAMILSVIEKILDNDSVREFARLKETERNILEQFRRDFTPDRNGLNITRGTFSNEHTWDGVYFSGVVDFTMDFAFGVGLYPLAGGYSAQNNNVYDPENDNRYALFNGASHPDSGDLFKDFTFNPSISFIGDIGKNISYGFTLTGLIIKSPRAMLGQYETTPFDPNDDRTYYSVFPTYSEPLAYFPYNYKKKWDGFVWATTQIDNGGQLNWPESVSIGYSMLPELSGALFNGHIMYRFARLDREWGSPINGGSLLLNKSAQPFLAFETAVTPFDWISFSSLTGVLEYNNAKSFNNASGLQETPKTFQDAFSIVMLEISNGKTFKGSLGSTVVWPKRFELGYAFPLIENFLYQNNIGDFDNMALFFNLEGQYSGLGKLWLSIFLDEMNPESNFFEKDRMMYAYQFGGDFYLPWLPFASIILSYTKIEPYNYTHNRWDVPWYRYDRMELNYVNFGKSLGHYLPPNSDEILFRVQTIPVPQSMINLQYQMIRHGADYGDRAVDGSSLWSELKEIDRSSMLKYFLRDGAYQWIHIIKLGGEYSFAGMNLPIKIIAEIGGVFSYFTDTDSELGTSGNYSVINVPQYPHSLSLIAFLGVQIFPKF
jgi:hypothetical protein